MTLYKDVLFARELDYCCTILYGLPKTATYNLQRVQNFAAKIILHKKNLIVHQLVWGNFIGCQLNQGSCSGCCVCLLSVFMVLLQSRPIYWICLQNWIAIIPWDLVDCIKFLEQTERHLEITLFQWQGWGSGIICPQTLDLAKLFPPSKANLKHICFVWRLSNFCSFLFLFITLYRIVL